MEIYNPEDVKNEFLNNVLPEYGRTYSRQQLDLAIYMLTDFVNNLTANDLGVIRLETEPQQQMPMPPQMPQQMPRQMAPQYEQSNPFEEDVQEYTDPRTQRMRVDDFSVQREVAEMNQQLRTPVPPRQFQQAPQQMQQMPQRPQMQPQPQVQQDINLGSEKNKSFVDKIKEMRQPKKKEGINPEE